MLYIYSKLVDSELQLSKFKAYTTQSVVVLPRCMENTSPLGFKLALGVSGDVFFDTATNNQQ
jgi:hypothetical protein